MKSQLIFILLVNYLLHMDKNYRVEIFVTHNCKTMYDLKEDLTFIYLRFLVTLFNFNNIIVSPFILNNLFLFLM